MMTHRLNHALVIPLLVFRLASYKTVLSHVMLQFMSSRACAKEDIQSYQNMIVSAFWYHAYVSAMFALISSP